MATACRSIAADLRAEHAAGQLPPIHLTANSGRLDNKITRAEAAASLETQARRWDREIATGERNEYDRARIGM
jgi:hypothetical protein